jgi:hypothetical protein
MAARQLSLTVVALFGLLAQACVPELRSAFVCAPDVTVPYSESPAEFMTPDLQKMAAFYASLGGEWSGELQCPSDSPLTGSVTISIQPDTLSQMKMIVGVDNRQIGIDCRHEGIVLASGQISLTGSSIGGLSGERAALDAKIVGSSAVILFTFDASYSPELASVDGMMTIASDLSISGVMEFAQQPTKGSDGTWEQVGVRCGLVFLGRMG